MKILKPMYASLFVALIFLAACSQQEKITTDASKLELTDASELELLVYKSPKCGCCAGWVSYMKENGFTVTVKELGNLDPIKKQYNIPDDMLSCHTSVIGKYFVEGHVPVEAVKKLIAEQPDIDGIALPGMPAGTAGMGGVKQGAYTIYAIKNGQATEYTKV